jgi:hypothetical protein
MGVHWPDLDEDISIRGFLRYGVWRSNDELRPCWPPFGSVLDDSPKVADIEHPTLEELEALRAVVPSCPWGVTFGQDDDGPRFAYIDDDRDGTRLSPNMNPKMAVMAAAAVNALPMLIKKARSG